MCKGKGDVHLVASAGCPDAVCTVLGDVLTAEFKSRSKRKGDGGDALGGAAVGGVVTHGHGQDGQNMPSTKSHGPLRDMPPPRPDVDFPSAEIMVRNDYTTDIPAYQFGPGIADPKGSHERDPYAIQVGFDYGTSSSKCIYRDLSRNMAFTYVRRTEDGRTAFLIPSTICYDHGVFRLNDSNEQYPSTGLFYTKMALEKASRGCFSDPVLRPFAKAAGTDDPAKVKGFVENAALFYLSRTLHGIRGHILKEYPDFGMNEYDDMFVNMAIPVSSAEDGSVRNAFLGVLGRAWNIAHRGHLSEETTVWELESDLGDEPDEGLVVNVYPEVSANVQAFINSPAASSDERTLYFFSDTGSGTVDQCCFTYTRRNQGARLNYFVGKVHDIGSGIIERMCSDLWGGRYEDWRRVKEIMPQELKYVTDRVETMLRSGSMESIRDLKGHLYDGFGVSPVETIRRHIRVIFSGGGHIEHPYAEGVARAFEMVTERRPQQVSIPYPRDLFMPETLHDAWIRRLYVAYGLSFLYDDLTTSIYPSETDISEETKTHADAVRQIVQCPCRGGNKNCVRCQGRGWYVPGE